MLGYIIAGVIVAAGIAKLIHKVFIEPGQWRKNHSEGHYGQTLIYYRAGKANSTKS